MGAQTPIAGGELFGEKGNMRRGSRILLFFLVLGIHVSAAMAEVVYHGNANVTVPVAYGSPDYYNTRLDFNEDGVTDAVIQYSFSTYINLGAGGGSQIDAGVASLHLPTDTVVFVNSSGAFPSLRPVENGDTISLQPASGGAWGNGSPYAYNYFGMLLASWSRPYPGHGPILWNNDQVDPFETITAVKFSASDGEHLGWFRLGFLPMSSGYPYLPQLVVRDWGYETIPGASITVVAVPEPSLIMPGILALLVCLFTRQKCTNNECRSKVGDGELE